MRVRYENLRNILSGTSRWGDPLVLWVIFFLWIACVLPNYLQTFSSPKRETTVANFGDTTDLVSLTQAAGFVGAAIIATLGLLSRLRSLPTDGYAPLAVAGGYWFAITISDMARGNAPSLSSLALPAFVLALWLTRPGPRVFRTLAVYVGLLVLSTLIIAVLFPSVAFYIAPSGSLASAEKQIVPGGMLVGPFNNPNTLAQALATGLAVLLVLSRRGPRVILVSILAFELVWTASRGSLMAATFGLVGAFVVGSASTTLRRVAAWALAVAAAAVVALVPLTVTDGSAFSGRGQIWLGSLHYWQLSPAFGLGSDWYRIIAQVNNELSPLAYHGHNVLISTLLTGGIVLASILLVLIASALIASMRAGFAPGVAVVLTLIALGLFETPIGAADRGPLFFYCQVPLFSVLFLWRRSTNEGLGNHDQLPRPRGLAAHPR